MPDYFEKIWNKRQKFVDIKDFDSYLFILSKYTVINYISTKRVIPIDIDSLSDRFANETSPHDEVVARIRNCLLIWWLRTCRPNARLFIA